MEHCTRTEKLGRMEIDIKQNTTDIKGLQGEVTQLKISDAELKTGLKQVVKSMDLLTKTLWGLIGGTGVGFIIWYIQSLPR